MPIRWLPYAASRSVRLSVKEGAALSKTVAIKLVKSLNGRHQKHIATAKSLGLKRPGNVVVQPDNEATRGKIEQIRYLVEVK